MNLTRRTFLGLTGAAASSTLDSVQAAPASPNSYAMLTDLSLCVGCRKCEWACKEANGLPNAPIETYEDKSVFDHTRRTDPENFTVVNRFQFEDSVSPTVDVKSQCMHCLEPACASACLVAAFTKTPEGPVVYDESVCIGCRYCMVACPFFIPTYTYDDPFTPAVRKCSMCHERVKHENKRPACAEVCPEEAITVGKRSDLLTLAREKITHNPDRYVDHVYGEFEAGGTSWLYVAPRDFAELGFRTDVGTTPYPELTKGFLSAVPLVLVIWPALLMGSYAFTQRRAQLAGRTADGGNPGHGNPGPEAVAGPAVSTTEVRRESDEALSNPPVTKTTMTSRGHSRSSWVRDKLFLGRSLGDYARGLLTPFNLIALLILCVGLPVAWIRFTQGLEATTNLSNDYPWGLWIGFDVLCGVALAAGGYVLASTVYLFGLEEYRPLLRPAILTGFLGYFFVVVGLCFDLGRPWRLPYPMLVSYGVTSVMFLVGWHVALYLTVQFLEFCPAIFEWLDATKLRRWVAKLTIGATVFGVILSTLHQSALGALFLLAPGKVHPLWYSPFIPVFFFISSIAAGIAMVIVESMLSHRVFHDQVADQDPGRIDRLVLGLGKAASVVLFTYFGLKWVGVAHGQVWGQLLTPYGFLFLLEVFGFVLLPCVMFAVAVRRKNPALVRLASVVTVLGIVLNRLNVSLLTYQLGREETYFPHWMEFVVTVTIVTVGVLTFRWMVNRMPVLRAHPRYGLSH